MGPWITVTIVERLFHPIAFPDADRGGVESMGGSLGGPATRLAPRRDHLRINWLDPGP
jgi:hypothetical protein